MYHHHILLVGDTEGGREELYRIGVRGIPIVS